MEIAEFSLNVQDLESECSPEKNCGLGFNPFEEHAKDWNRSVPSLAALYPPEMLESHGNWQGPEYRLFLPDNNRVGPKRIEQPRRQYRRALPERHCIHSRAYLRSRRMDSRTGSNSRNRDNQIRSPPIHIRTSDGA